MNRYSNEQFTRRLLPGLRPCVAGRFWTAIVPDEPYRAKGLCRGGNFPLRPCTFAAAPHFALILKSDCFLGSYRRLRKNLSLASLQLRKLSFRLRRFAVLARRRSTFEEKLRADLPILGFIVPEV